MASRHRRWFILAILAGSGCLMLLAAAAAEPRRVARPADDADAVGLAAFIDQMLELHWQAANITPAPPVDDTGFVRRVHLDLIGRIPSVAEVRKFLEDRRPDRRARLVDELLNSPGYANHFTHLFREALVPELRNNPFGPPVIAAFEAWLRQKLVENTPYDAMVRELLTVSMASAAPANFQAMMRRPAASPLGFYVAKDFQPEHLAGGTARAFLGLRLECAQCHNHFFAPWTQEQFWNFAAFFARINSTGPEGATIPVEDDHTPALLAIPGKDKIVPAKFPDGTTPQLGADDNPRHVLAAWITSKDNPYFAKAMVNRLWGHFFGVGLIEPVDDLESELGAGFEPLLKEMARQFAEQNYDLKFVLRAITLSRAYQLSSRLTDSSQRAAHGFGRMAVKRLSPEQIFDSLALATGYREARGPAAPQPLLERDTSPRAEFLRLFRQPVPNATAAETSILQALTLMNGRFINEATHLANSETLAAVSDAPFMSTAAKVEALFLAAVGRPPGPEELRDLTRYIDRGGPTKNPALALADVFWALLNSSEFIHNH